MIGLKQIKENVVDQILFYIQKLHLPLESLDSDSLDSDSLKKDSSDSLKKESLDSDSLKKESLDSDSLTLTRSKDFMHTVIYGPPGTGKTEIAKILGAIFAKMGVLTKGGFKKVTRSDLVAGFLGQTALKTRDVIKESLGGVLFIDEAYSLGSKEKKDSFSKECIDTLCEALSDHKDNLMVIIAGYETELNDCFFDCNQGLSSRFTWRFKVDEYSATDLYNIFIKKVTEGGWTKENNISELWFEKHKSSFKFYGRDIETLFAKTKIAHSRRVFCLAPEFKRIITIVDLNKGLDIYLKNESFSSNKEKEKEEAAKKYFSHMYM
jgi:SpoVK/Ycf46/Vps4 family AAA+-type ATPase